MYFNPQPKDYYLRDQGYLDWLKGQPPLILGRGDTVYHHIKLFGRGGTGIKPPDDDCIPISDSIHQRIHNSKYGEKRVLLKEHRYTVEALRDLCDAYRRIYLREQDRKKNS